MYICAKGKEIHLQEGENTMIKQEIKKEILKEALNYLKNKKAYDENPCETSEDDVNHMLQEDAYLSSMERMEELYEFLFRRAN
jgi:predicted DNA-binding antitoxin AbrB/MazE fold protein